MPSAVLRVSAMSYQAFMPSSPFSPQELNPLPVLLSFSRQSRPVDVGVESKNVDFTNSKCGSALNDAAPNAFD